MTQQNTEAFEVRYLELQCPVGAGEITSGAFEGFG